MSSAKPPEEQNLSFHLLRSLLRTDLKMLDVADYLFNSVPTVEGKVRLMALLASLIRCAAPEELCATPLTPAQELLACFLLWYFAHNLQAVDVAQRLLLDVCDYAFGRQRDSHVRVFLLYLIGGGIGETCSQYAANMLASRFCNTGLSVPSDADENNLRAFVLQDHGVNPAAPFASRDPFVQSAFAGVVLDTNAGLSVDAMMQGGTLSSEVLLQKLLVTLQDVYAPSLPLSFAPIAPPLLELGDDELPFTYPQAVCDKHMLDLTFPMTRATPRDALLLACSAPLKQKQFDKLHDLLLQSEARCPISALQAAAPQILSMIENNPSLVPHYLHRVENSNNNSLKNEVREKLCNAPLKLPIFEVVFETYKSDSSMPNELLVKYCHAVLDKCQTLDKKGKKADAEVAALNGVVNLVAKFFSSLFSVTSTSNIIKKDASLLTEIQEFCVRFPKLKEPAKLYETIRKISRT